MPKKRDPITLKKDLIRQNVLAVLIGGSTNHCTLEDKSNHEDERAISFYISVSFDDREIGESIMVTGSSFDEVNAIAIIRARALAGEYEQ